MYQSERAAPNEIISSNADNLFTVNVLTMYITKFQDNTKNWLAFRDAFNYLIIQNKNCEYQRLVYFRR